ncbi:MAG: metallophosphoesterase, partial [Myxococcota bacterium]|nr:metallophosphoesterase [Myxococcota bacterium]
IREASERGVDLQLSGHTHGGQFAPFSSLVVLDQPYRSGLYTIGASLLYVNEGTGYWGPPLRIGTRSEITELVLRANP